MKNNFYYLALSLLAATTLFSCSSDDDVAPVNEEEVITTVELFMSDSTMLNRVVTFKSTDPDGDGPMPSIFTGTGNLLENTTYTGSLRLLNELESPAENIAAEVRLEDDEHEVFYTTTLPGTVIEKTDTDDNGNPVGLNFILTTGAAGTGNITVTLRHLPTKPNDGTLSGAGGETDVQVVFNVEAF